MKVNVRIAAATAFLLIAAVFPLANVAAHDFCFGPKDACGPCTPGENHSHTEVDINTVPPTVTNCESTAGNLFCPHSSPHSHSYGSGGSTGARSDSANAGRTAGVTTVSDNNVNDCNGDGIPGDFDGDYEAGVGGGFFGFGPWANEPICTYGLATHGGTITVTDVVFGGAVQFVIGADDTSGPVISTDPVTGATTCTTDGAITPGDPAQDPTRDADDCLTPVIDGAQTAPPGTGTTCGAGGDGGYWVFLLGARVHENGNGATVNNPATSGTIMA